jgi:hypothetical protein
MLALPGTSTTRSGAGNREMRGLPPVKGVTSFNLPEASLYRRGIRFAAACADAPFPKCIVRFHIIGTQNEKAFATLR